MTVSVRRLGISRPLVVSVTVVSTMVSTVGIGSIGSVAVAVAMAIRRLSISRPLVVSMAVVATVVSNGRVAIAVTMAVAIAKSVAGISLWRSSGSREQAQCNNTNGLHLRLISASLRSLQGLPMY